MKGFARMTKLGNIGGRAGYITNTDKQEEIVEQSVPVDWEPYAEYERTHQKSDTKNNDGRELVFSIPNDWYGLPKQELHTRVQTLAELAIGKSTDMQWAVHWNKNRTNLHVHVIFSERQKIENPGRWDRDIYHTDDGKVARKKADRALDANGSVKPPVHRKGELKDAFTPKDTQYKSKEWLHETKQRLVSSMREMYGVAFEAPSLLHEYHEGKGSDAPAIKKKNEIVRATNLYYNKATADYRLSDESKNDIKNFAMMALSNGQVAEIKVDDDGRSMARITLEKHYRMREKEKSKVEQSHSAEEPVMEIPVQTAISDLLLEDEEKPQRHENAPVASKTAPERPAEPLQAEIPPLVLKTPSEGILDVVRGLQAEETSIRAEIDDLRAQKRSLSFLAFKKKNALEDQITEKDRELRSFDAKYKELGKSDSFDLPRYIDYLEQQVVKERFELQNGEKQLQYKGLDAKLQSVRETMKPKDNTMNRETKRDRGDR